MEKISMDIECKDLDFIEAQFIKVRQSTIKGGRGRHIELQQVGAPQHRPASAWKSRRVHP